MPPVLAEQVLYRGGCVVDRQARAGNQESPCSPRPLPMCTLPVPLYPSKLADCQPGQSCGSGQFSDAPDPYSRAGYALGGGWGMFSKLAGMASDNILGMTVALPSGELVEANETNEHADLFWAMRGAGHNNFGVMTSLKYR